MAYETLRMTIWNCNGSLRTDVGYFEDTFKNTDIAMYTETHQCMASKLPEDIDGSQYVIPNLEHQEALEVREEWLCYTKRSSMIECILSIRMYMHATCGYESKEGILGSYILQFATFHLPTQGLRL